MKTIIPKDKKIEILCFQLGERYRAMHEIRNRVQNISLWLLGLFATGGGWFMQANIILNGLQKVLLGLVVAVVYSVIRFYYLYDLDKGFINQRKITAKIEDCLGLYSNNVYTKKSVFPDDWKCMETKNMKGNYFSTNYVMIGLGTMILLLGILLQGKL